MPAVFAAVCFHRCPTMHDWYEETMRNGGRVCAKVYSGSFCRGSSHRLGEDRPRTFSVQSRSADGSMTLSALVRTGCMLFVWPNDDRSGTPTVFDAYASNINGSEAMSFVCKCPGEKQIH
ncbi:hypothetical protein AAVH_37540 [Aphelenchoides avenae]|nr:hypothetical protein AAVH_37540 [Aphelenchus avenae]